jgi:hypothetical protein
MTAPRRCQSRGQHTAPRESIRSRRTRASEDVNSKCQRVARTERVRLCGAEPRLAKTRASVAERASPRKFELE